MCPVGVKCKKKNSLQIPNLGPVENSITKQRLKRFMASANYDLKKAIEIYLWNCRLSESFIMPLHVCEVVCRNSIQKALRVRLKSPWYEQEEFLRLLATRQRNDLISTVSDEKAQHSSRMNDDHVVSSLNFGFWDHLTTKRFDRLLWIRGISHNFSNAYRRNLTIRDINSQIQTVRQWRNRIAHHRAIFDREPAKKFEQIITLIECSCLETASWVRINSNVMNVLNNPPKNLEGQ